jgi:CheY-like chemotaxis protein
MKTVLLCEDDSDMVGLIQAVVEHAGYQLVRAENGREAVDMALKTKPDLVLMDLRMPIMDGAAATRVLRDKGYAAPIVILTASEKAEDRKRATQAGANAFILKNSVMSDVEDTLQRLLGSDDFDLDLPDPGAK